MKFIPCIVFIASLLFSQERNPAIISVPESSHVYINDIFWGTTPCRVSVPDSTDSFSIRILKEGFLPVTFSMHTRELQDTLLFTLRKRASLTVITSPDNASLFLDGVLYGKTPLTVDTIQAKLFSVTVIKQQYNPYNVDVTTIGGENIRLSATLQRYTNTISLSTENPQTEISLDGKMIGLGSIDSVEARYGAHTIAVFDPARKISAERVFILNTMESRKFESQLQRFTYSKMALGIAIPGFNQFTDGNLIEGTLLSGAAVYGLFLSIRTRSLYNRQLHDYTAARDEYLHYTNEQRLIELRNNVIVTHDAMQKTARSFNTALIIPAVVWILNGWSVIGWHSLTDSIIEISQNQTVAISPGNGTAALNIAYHINF